MTPTEKKDFTFLMINVAEIYNKKLSQPMLDIYWRCLEAYSFAQISMALKIHLLHPDHGQFMPKPADILRAINGNTGSQATLAWNKVLQSIRRVGSYESVVFDDPLIHLVIMDLGGWIALCQHDSKSLIFVAKDFEKIYSIYLQRKPNSYPNKLIGQTEHKNKQAGFSHQELRLLGEKNKALQVLQNGCDPIDYTQQYAGTKVDNNQLIKLTPSLKKHLATTTKFGENNAKN